MKKFFQLKRSFSIQDYLSYNDEIIDPGNGKTNGLEIQLRKKYGLVSGWVSYHNSSVKYKISEFNEDEFFSADHDKNHELKTVVLGKFFNTDISASWVFSSGHTLLTLKTYMLNLVLDMKFSTRPSIITGFRHHIILI